jgi:hypothetical protein
MVGFDAEDDENFLLPLRFRASAIDHLARPYLNPPWSASFLRTTSESSEIGKASKSERRNRQSRNTRESTGIKMGTKSVQHGWKLLAPVWNCWLDSNPQGN